MKHIIDYYIKTESDVDRLGWKTIKIGNDKYHLDYMNLSFKFDIYFNYYRPCINGEDIYFVLINPKISISNNIIMVDDKDGILLDHFQYSIYLALLWMMRQKPNYTINNHFSFVDDPIILKSNKNYPPSLYYDNKKRKKYDKKQIDEIIENSTIDLLHIKMDGLRILEEGFAQDLDILQMMYSD